MTLITVYRRMATGKWKGGMLKDGTFPGINGMTDLAIRREPSLNVIGFSGAIVVVLLMTSDTIRGQPSKDTGLS